MVSESQTDQSNCFEDHGDAGSVEARAGRGRASTAHRTWNGAGEPGPAVPGTPFARLTGVGVSDIVLVVNVRRLAAIDMYGSKGSMRRRQIIQAEFVVGVVGMISVGIWILTQSSDLTGRVLGLWFIGAGLNYAPLASYAVMLSRAGALDAELAGVGTARELRRYGVLQLWILVPLALVAFAGFKALSDRAHR